MISPRRLLAGIFGRRSQRLIADSARVEPELTAPIDLIAVPVPDPTPESGAAPLSMGREHLGAVSGHSVAHSQPGLQPGLQTLPVEDHAARLLDWLRDADPAARLSGDVLACEIIEAYHEMCAEQWLEPRAWSRVSPLFKRLSGLTERYVWHLLPGDTVKSRLKMFSIPGPSVAGSGAALPVPTQHPRDQPELLSGPSAAHQQPGRVAVVSAHQPRGEVRRAA